MKTQRVLLCAWLVELKLDKLNKLGVKPDDETGGLSPGNAEQSPSRRSQKFMCDKLTEDFKRFLDKYEPSLDSDTIFQLLQNNGKLNECLALAEQKNKFETVVLHYINNRDITKALEVLKRVKGDKRNELMVKYASVFMKHEPDETLRCLMHSFQDVQVENILPALMSVDSKHRQAANDYIRTCMDGSNSKLLHNLYMFFLAESTSQKSSEELIEFLTQQETLQTRNQPLNIDKDFALNVCKYFKRKEAQIHVYSMLEFYEEAVKLALDTGNLELAKKYAKKPSDEKICKKLWLDIAHVSMAQARQDEHTGLEIINDSEGHLILNDLLPMISPKVKLKIFRDDILAQLNHYGDRIKKLQGDMEGYNKIADEVMEQMKGLHNCCIDFTSDKFCDHCQKALLGTGKFYVFPCLHAFHRVWNARNNPRIELHRGLDVQVPAVYEQVEN